MPAACAGWLLAAAPAPAEQAGLSRAEVYRRAAALTDLGRRMFFDTRLSASGRLSCASCHDPAFAYGPPNGRAVQLGGEDMRQSGPRAVPGLKYLRATPQFQEHYHDSDEEADESVDNGPTGGLTWDGRVDSGHAQARLPLLSPAEMANASVAAVVERARAAGYDAELRRLFGETLFDDADRAFDAITMAFESFEQDVATFEPYSSKYDAVLAGKATLTEAEAHGLALFNDPAKGNCASCHISERAKDGTPPQFTDHGLIALGVPRNPEIPANADPGYHDLGLCGPMRTDLQDRPEYCGLFKTPTLRNVALRTTFFHNGAFHDLREVVRFYVQRDTNPEKWYPRAADGSVRKFDDLPAQYHENVNMEPPFGGQPGDEPALTDSEITDLVAFLRTLTDGYGT